MKGDLLEEATRALRASGNEAKGSDLTRGRIMQSLHADKRKRSSRWAFGLPVAAIFVASAAAAQVTGVLPRALERVAVVFRADPVPAAPAEPPVPAVRGSAAPQGSAPPPEPAETPDLVAASEDAPEAPADDVASPGVAAAPAAPTLAHRGADAPAAPNAQRRPKPGPGAAPPAASAPSATGAAGSTAAADASQPAAQPTSQPAVDPAHVRYLEAHQAHFTAHDYARALGLWERYLKEFPRGRFAAEAQYNRAVCLVRLGRYSAAKAALEPFAAGRYGGYRQSEAQALIAALEPTKPSASAAAP